MSEVSVEFSFDEAKMKQKGVKKEDIYYTLKKKFSKVGFHCDEKDDVLIFFGSGKKEDYVMSWYNVLPLIYCEWFTDCASHCVINKDNVEYEVLANVPRAKEIVKYCMELGGISERYA